MKIISVTASYGYTQSLPEYSNVKPSLSLTAEVGPHEHPADVYDRLFAECQAAVHHQIDAALEANGKRAKFDPAPRFQVVQTDADYWQGPDGVPHRLIAILPDSLQPPPAGFLHTMRHGGDSRGLRFDHARRVAAKLASTNDQVIDCSDGDMAKLPQKALPPVDPNAGWGFEDGEDNSL